jgi:hypothetical protein
MAKDQKTTFNLQQQLHTSIGSRLELRLAEIDSSVLQDACRLADRERFKDPLKTLNNAKGLGLLDSGRKRGKFGINTVGENLIAMTLPGGPDDSAKRRNPRKLKRQPQKPTKVKK